MSKISLQNFFSRDYVNQASYDNTRKIASAVDGLKNASRKVICTVLDKKINEPIKVQQISAKVSEYTDYLHGSLDGVVVSLGQNFTGSNNLPLLNKKGNFGTRAIPSASASRYIYGSSTKYLDKIYSPKDTGTLQVQYFEGTKIEPLYYVPTIPMILVNGNRGVSSGFAQLILGRNPSELITLLKKRLKGTIKSFDEADNLTP